MVDPGRSLLQGAVEVDGTTVPFRSKHDPAGPPKPGRSVEGKIPIAGAVQLSEKGEPRRIRLKTIDSYSAEELRASIAETVGPGARVITDGWRGCSGLPDSPREARVVGKRKAHGIPNGPTGSSRT